MITFDWIPNKVIKPSPLYVNLMWISNPFVASIEDLIQYFRRKQIVSRYRLQKSAEFESKLKLIATLKLSHSARMDSNGIFATQSFQNWYEKNQSSNLEMIYGS